MKLTGRNLAYNLSGKDVAALQSALQRLGYDLPAAELEAMHFSAETQKAVWAVQKGSDLPSSGLFRI